MDYRLLTRGEVEEWLSVSRNTLDRMITERRIPPPVRIGPRSLRWASDDLEAWVQSRKKETAR